jgi:hypothetical protein
LHQRNLSATDKRGAECRATGGSKNHDGFFTYKKIIKEKNRRAFLSTDGATAYLFTALVAGPGVLLLLKRLPAFYR